MDRGGWQSTAMGSQRVGYDYSDLAYNVPLCKHFFRETDPKEMLLRHFVGHFVH